MQRRIPQQVRHSSALNLNEARLSRRQALMLSAGAAGLSLAGVSLLGVSSPTATLAAAQTTSGVDEAQQLVSQWAQPHTSFDPPGPAFDASGARGKTVWVIEILSIPFAQLNVQGAQEAFDKAGVKMVPFDGKGQVAETSRGIGQAIGQNADMILVASLPGQNFKPDFDRAQAAGIPVAMIENHDPGGVSPDEPPGVVAELNQNHAQAGQIMADYTVADAGGNGVNAMVLWSSDAPGIGQPQLDGINNELKRLAPDAQVTVKDVLVAQWESQIPTITQSSLLSDPNLRYLLPLYDGMALFMLPAVHAANAQDRVKLVSFNTSPAVMQSMANHDVVVADCGTDPVRFGWTWVDQCLRVMTGNAPVPDIKLPIRLFTSDTVSSIDLSQPIQTWFGDVDFRSAYLNLWGSHG
jgi:ribose transport system substrate-binding protein